jgi:hypothetical protein
LSRLRNAYPDLDFSVVDGSVEAALGSPNAVLAAAKEHAGLPHLELTHGDPPLVSYIGPLEATKPRFHTRAAPATWRPRIGSQDFEQASTDQPVVTPVSEHHREHCEAAPGRAGRAFLEMT